MSDFSYFDQFTDVEVNMNPYLTDIKNDTGYDYHFNNIQPVKTNLANIFNKINIVDTFKQDTLNFDPYKIQDDDRIENISYNKYGSIDYWWTIAIFNNIKNMFTDWPMSESQLSELSTKLYTTENKYSKNAYYELLFERNETKRNIILPKTIFVNKIVAGFRDAFEKG